MCACVRMQGIICNKNTVAESVWKFLVILFHISNYKYEMKLGSKIKKSILLHLMFSPKDKFQNANFIIS